MTINLVRQTVVPGVSQGEVPVTGYPGRTDGSVVPTGSIGQYIAATNFVTSFSMASNTPYNFASIALTAGEYLLFQSISYSLASATSLDLLSEASSASAVLEGISIGRFGSTAAISGIVNTASQRKVTVPPAGATYYVNGRTVVSTGSVSFNNGPSYFFALRIG